MSFKQTFNTNVGAENNCRRFTGERYRRGSLLSIRSTACVLWTEDYPRPWGIDGDQDTDLKAYCLLEKNEKEIDSYSYSETSAKTVV